MAIELIRDSIELAKDLAHDLDLKADLPTEEDIYSALYLMNSHLFSVRREGRELLKASTIFVIPDHPADVETIEDWEVEESKVHDTVFSAKVEQFAWFGSLSTTGFGLRVWGVDFIHPKRHHTGTAFVPIACIDVKLAV